MSKRTIKHVIDLAHPPLLTARQKAELEALKAMPADDIDTSDIPPLTEDFWRRAKRNPFYKAAKAMAKGRSGTARSRLSGTKGTRGAQTKSR